MMKYIQKISNKISKLKIQHQILLFAAIGILIYLIYSACGFYMDYIEFKEINVNFTKYLTQNLFFRGITCLIIFAVVYIYMFIQNKIIVKIISKFAKEENVEIKKKLPNKSIVLPVAFFIAITQAEAIYQKLLMFINSVSFTGSDPIFNNNIAFYVFQRPFIMQMFDSLSLVAILITLYTLGYYITVFGSIFDGVKPKSLFRTGFITHNIFNVLVVVVIKTVEILFSKQDILFSRFMNNQFDIVKQLIGSGWTESNILLNMYRILPFLIIILVVMLLINYRKREYKRMIMPVILFPCIWIITYIIMITVQFIYVKPNELALESQYIKYNLDMTKQGYNVTGLENSDIEIENDITKEDVYSKTNVANNIDTVIPNYLLSSLNNNLIDTNYYAYKNIDIAVDKTGDKPSITYLTPKEVNKESVKHQSYINRHFKYTHGFGLTKLQNDFSNIITTENNEQSTLPLLTTNENAINTITQPRIYYGENKNDYVVANSSSIYELDYTKNSKELVESQYKGNSGIPMTWFNKFMMSCKKLDPQLLVSNYVDKNSKLLINTNVVDRAKKILPFLIVDENPYITVGEDGKLIWVVDAYTETSSYPYSEYTTLYVGETKKAMKINYIRNSVKVLIDAYDGTTKIYVTDNSDPIALTYMNMYPYLFTNKDNDETYNSVMDQFKYPQMLFDIQTNILNQYYTEHTETFYRNDSKLDAPTYINNENKTEKLGSYYAVTKLNNMTSDDLVLLQPYTMAGKDNLKGYFAGLVENGMNKLKQVSFKNDNKVLGSQQLDELMSNNKELQLELKTLRDTRNEVIKKEILLPFENKILYAQLYYSKAIDKQDSDITLQIIVLSDGKNIIINNSNNFNEAFDKLFNSTSTDIVPEDIINGDLSSAINTTIQTFNDMKSAANQGQWEVFGRDLQRLEEALTRLKEQNDNIKTNTEDVENNKDNISQ